MTARERVIKMFGGIEKVPAYLRRALGLREKARDESRQRIREHEERQQHERDRVKALRRPPTDVRIEGRRIYWDPPETAGELEPAGYWVSEKRNGEWTKHGDYVLPHVRSAVLFGNHDGSAGPAYVETWYHGMALGEMYRSPVVGE